MINAMRDRLVELIDKGMQECEDSFQLLETLYDLADYLIENGVIVPPCKVGNWVYRITYNYSNGKRMCHISGPIQIVGFHLGTFPTIRGHKRKNYLIGYSDNLLMHLDINEIGKTIFFSEEEAKSKIKEV